MSWSSEKIVNGLGHYVYCLVDPGNNEIFYVGKGQGNRVFAHEEEVRRGLQAENLVTEEENIEAISTKHQCIRDIFGTNAEVGKYIVCHGLASAEEAFKVESALISLLRSDLVGRKLANHQSGHHDELYGLKSVREIEELYGLEPLDEEYFQCDNILIVNISNSYDGESDCYEATRGDWHTSEERLSKTDHYVIAEYKGMFIDIFKPIWKKIEGSSRMRFEKDDSVDLADHRKKYCEGKRNGFRTKSSGNPIRYVGPWSK